MASEVELVDFERKKKHKSSEVWLYFGFVKRDDGVVDKGQVGCRLCKKIFKYSSTTTNMRVHLDRHHWSELHPAKAVENCPQKAESAQSKESNTSKTQGTISTFLQKPYTYSSARAKSLNRGLAEFLVRDMRPVSLIEGDGFKDFCHLLDPRYKVISRNTCLEKFIVPMYKLSAEEVKKGLAKCPAHSFTTDAWTNKSMLSFITTTAHCIDPTSFELKAFVLDTCHVTDRHTSEMLCRHMEETEEKWNLKHVTGVSDNAANIQNAFIKHDIPHIGCFAHTINLAVSKGLDESSVKRLTGKVRSLVSTFKHSYIKTDTLHQNEKLLELKELQLVQDVITRWNSVYYMIDRLLAVYPAVYGSLYGGADEKLLLTDDERKNLEELKKLLEPFEKATRLVSSEKLPTGGLILPYLESFLTKKLVAAPGDSNLIKKAKQLMKDDLEKRYKDQWELLATLSALDPRVRSLDWIDESQKVKLYEHLKDLCISSTSLPEIESVDSDEFNENKRRRTETATVDDDFDGLINVAPECSTDGTESTAIIDRELESYKKELSLGLKYDEPLQWWRANQYRYPHLTKVMLKMLHIPASSVPSERVFSSAGNMYRRRELTPENANMMIFLYHNYAKTKHCVHLNWPNWESTDTESETQE